MKDRGRGILLRDTDYLRPMNLHGFGWCGDTRLWLLAGAQHENRASVVVGMLKSEAATGPLGLVFDGQQGERRLRARILKADAYAVPEDVATSFMALCRITMQREAHLYHLMWDDLPDASPLEGVYITSDGLHDSKGLFLKLPDLRGPLVPQELKQKKTIR